MTTSALPVQEVLALKCAICGEDMPVSGVRPDPRYPREIDDALDLVFHGGYGDFIDNGILGDPQLRVTICHDCTATKLLPLFQPSIQDYFRRGHSAPDKANPCCEYAA
jgi:hypothetical protein